MMIWQVKDLAATLARDFQPGQLIAFSIMSDASVERRLKIRGKLLDAVMVEFIRLVDQNEPVLLQFLELAHKTVMEEIKAGTSDKCVICEKPSHISLVVALPEASYWISFCEICQLKPDLFFDATPLDVFQGKVPSTQIAPNFRRQLSEITSP